MSIPEDMVIAMRVDQIAEDMQININFQEKNELQAASWNCPEYQNDLSNLQFADVVCSNIGQRKGRLGTDEGDFPQCYDCKGHNYSPLGPYSSFVKALWCLIYPWEVTRKKFPFFW